MKKFKGDKINEKISRAPRMEDLIFLKLMCYSKWSTELMQFLSKFWRIFKEIAINPKIHMKPQMSPTSQSSIEKLK